MESRGLEDSRDSRGDLGEPADSQRFRAVPIQFCTDPGLAFRFHVRVTFGKRDLWCARIRSKSAPRPPPGSKLTRFSNCVRPWRRGDPPRAKNPRTKGHSGERSPASADSERTLRITSASTSVNVVAQKLGRAGCHAPEMDPLSAPSDAARQDPGSPPPRALRRAASPAPSEAEAPSAPSDAARGPAEAPVVIAPRPRPRRPTQPAGPPPSHVMVAAQRAGLITPKCPPTAVKARPPKCPPPKEAGVPHIPTKAAPRTAARRGATAAGPEGVQPRPAPTTPIKKKRARRGATAAGSSQGAPEERTDTEEEEPLQTKIQTEAESQQTKEAEKETEADTKAEAKPPQTREAKTVAEPPHTKMEAEAGADTEWEDNEKERLQEELQKTRELQETAEQRAVGRSRSPRRMAMVAWNRASRAWNVHCLTLEAVTNANIADKERLDSIRKAFSEASADADARARRGLETTAMSRADAREWALMATEASAFVSLRIPCAGMPL